VHSVYIVHEGESERKRTGCISLVLTRPGHHSLDSAPTTARITQVFALTAHTREPRLSVCACDTALVESYPALPSLSRTLVLHSDAPPRTAALPPSHFAKRTPSKPFCSLINRLAEAPNPTGSRKISFNVSEQYDIQDVVGEGAYGVVW
jgi:hypothetical protein